MVSCSINGQWPLSWVTYEVILLLDHSIIFMFRYRVIPSCPSSFLFYFESKPRRPGPKWSGFKKIWISTNFRESHTNTLTDKYHVSFRDSIILPIYLEVNVFMDFRIKRIRGGHKRRASFIQSCSNCISLILLQSKCSSSFPSKTFFCSAAIRF